MNYSKETKLMIKAARKASDIAMQYFGKPVPHTTKSSFFDWVTKADVKAEKEIIAILSDKHPEHGFIAEESGRKKGNEFNWIVDPIDGTNNFASGIPYFCHAISLAKGDEIIRAVVFDPTRKDLFVAEKGKGAFLNKKRLHVSKRSNLKEFTCVASLRAAMKKSESKRIGQKEFVKLFDNIRSIRMFGSSELDLSYLAAGRFEAFISHNATPWDEGAGSLLVREAGGIASNAKGKPWTFEEKMVIASNGKRHKEIMKILGL